MSARAQGFRVHGVVARVAGRDTVPLRNTRVLLHQVSMAGGAPVDSGFTDAQGGYRLRSAKRDTGSVYFVSASFAGISYVSPPVHPPAQPETAVETLYVFDTSSIAPPIALDQRHVVIRAPDADGSRRVVELLVLKNSGTVTHIADDTLHAVWGAVLPRGAIQFEVGESDVSDQAVLRRGDSMLVFAPVPPGQKQVIVGYVLPGTQRELVLPVDQPVAQINVLVEDTLATLAEGALTAVGNEKMEGSTFARFAGDHVAGGLPVVIKFTRGPLSLDRYVWVIVLIAGVGLAVGLALWLRRPPLPAIVEAPLVERLAAQIAALDERYEGRRDQVPAADAADYRARRAALMAELNAALAARPPAG